MVKIWYGIGQLLGVALFMFGLGSLVGPYWTAMVLGLVIVVMLTAAEARSVPVMTEPKREEGR